MEMKHDKTCLYESNKVWVETGLGNEVVTKICFRGKGVGIIKEIADHLEKNYKMYQYVKDNGVNSRECELFFWTNGREDMKYFDVTIKAKPIEKHNSILNEIVDYIENNCSDQDLYVRLQYGLVKDWTKINDFLKQEFDMNNLPFDVLRLMHGDYKYSGTDYTEESVQKLNMISDNFLEEFEGKKVLLNGEIKGTIRKLGDHFGLFKPRARKNYYKISLGDIQSLVVE